MRRISRSLTSPASNPLAEKPTGQWRKTPNGPLRAVRFAVDKSTGHFMLRKPLCNMKECAAVASTALISGPY
jgi:hypothetical protein